MMGEGQQLYKQAKKIIPGGTQLLSKRPEMFLPEFWPAYYKKAKGCQVWDLDGNEYTDVSYMGIGASVLGYAFDAVDDKAKKAIDEGVMCTLNAPEEYFLAEKLLKLHPWADMVRYSKSGGEAVAMAVRIARAYTGKDKVLICGYHGWHDWYLSANLTGDDSLGEHLLNGLDPAGVPKGLAGTNIPFHYNNLEEFKQIIEANKNEIAAIVMEPIRNDYPNNGFLESIRSIATEKGIVLIFDEITAGFRLTCGGSHLVLEIEPDMAVFGKAIANGYPITAVIGKKDVMSAAQDTFISSTFWTEKVGLAAAIASIEFYEKNKVEDHLAKIGQKVQEGWKECAERNNISIHISGIYPLSHFEFMYEDSLALKTYFTQEMLKQRFLASNAFYVSLAHTEEVVNNYLEACDKVFSNIHNIFKSKKTISTYLDGEICQTGFQRLN